MSEMIENPLVKLKKHTKKLIWICVGAVILGIVSQVDNCLENNEENVENSDFPICWIFLGIYVQMNIWNIGFLIKGYRDPGFPIYWELGAIVLQYSFLLVFDYCSNITEFIIFCTLLMYVYVIGLLWDIKFSKQYRVK